MEESKHYLGIPRALIPWHPAVDAEACVGCGLCVRACKHGVYAEEDGKALVAHPYECEVFCQSCMFQCEVDAISFPDRAAVKAVIKGLRQQYPPR
jgi:NAD-dependent dihydropyrimidine dehydrogenase PreA subunit